VLPDLAAGEATGGGQHPSVVDYGTAASVLSSDFYRDGVREFVRGGITVTEDSPREVILKIRLAQAWRQCYTHLSGLRRNTQKLLKVF
jgi:hypothetical protein